MGVVVAFLLGLMFGEVLGQKPKVTLIDGNEVVGEVSNQNQIIVIREEDQVQVREILNPAITPKPKHKVVKPGPVVFHKDHFGDWTVDCRTCMEEEPGPLEQVIWKSSDTLMHQPMADTAGTTEDPLPK